ncbi:MAG: hypothetical protein ACXABY_30750 [Candidatus Thorarchaeota archaeon]|jgi:hypothetical protein
MSSNGDGKAKNPAAGCQNCGSSAWVLMLDEFPPNHTKIIAFVCSGYNPETDQRTLCNAIMRVDIKLEDMRDMSDREPVEEGDTDGA